MREPKRAERAPRTSEQKARVSGTPGGARPSSRRGRACRLGGTGGGAAGSSRGPAAAGQPAPSAFALGEAARLRALATEAPETPNSNCSDLKLHTRLLPRPGSPPSRLERLRGPQTSRSERRVRTRRRPHPPASPPRAGFSLLLPPPSSVRKRDGLSAAPGEKPRNILVALSATSDKPPARHSRGARQGHQNRRDYLHLHSPPPSPRSLPF